MQAVYQHHLPRVLLFRHLRGGPFHGSSMGRQRHTFRLSSRKLTFPLCVSISIVSVSITSAVAIRCLIVNLSYFFTAHACNVLTSAPSARTVVSRVGVVYYISCVFELPYIECLFDQNTIIWRVFYLGLCCYMYSGTTTTQFERLCHDKKYRAGAGLCAQRL